MIKTYRTDINIKIIVCICYNSTYNKHRHNPSVIRVKMNIVKNSIFINTRECPSKSA